MNLGEIISEQYVRLRSIIQKNIEKSMTIKSYQHEKNL